MSTASVREIVKHKRKEYLAATKSEKKRILNEVQELTCCHTKLLLWI